MICYRDMTFCTAACRTATCPRKFTLKDRWEAKSWWGDAPGEPPVAFADMSQDCPDYRPKGADQ
jgi:hypothetical protein